MYTHILISTDGSEVAQKGVDHGLSLAGLLGSKVTIVTVTEPFPISAMAGHGGWNTGSADLKRYQANQKAFADGILLTAKDTAKKIGLEINTIHVPDAWPASSIVDVAQEIRCDLIVMASHGHQGFARVMLGSQTTGVLTMANVPVLVIR